MPNPSWCALAVTLAVAGACSRTIEDKVVEARKALCTTYCDRKAECPGELPTPSFATRDECFRQCTEIGGSFDAKWGRGPETDKDMCAEQWTAKIECETALTCEERRAEATTLISESHCGALSVAASECSRQYRDGGR